MWVPASLRSILFWSRVTNLPAEFAGSKHWKASYYSTNRDSGPGRDHKTATNSTPRGASGRGYREAAASKGPKSSTTTAALTRRPGPNEALPGPATSPASAANLRRSRTAHQARRWSSPIFTATSPL
jgi:hypothetical protein